MNKIVTIATFVFSTFIAKAQIFNDPQLVSLIDTALVHNADLRIALLNVEQAEASLRAARLAVLPSASISGEANITKTGASSAIKAYTIPLSMQWEVDLAGRIRGERKTAEATWLNAGEMMEATRVSIVAAVAGAYYSLRMLDEHLVITRESIGIAGKTLETMEEMMMVGLANELAVSQSRASLFHLNASEKTLLQQISVAENALIVLVGKRFDVIERGKLDGGALPIDFKREYSLASLSERPDVKAAEYSLQSEIAQVGIARSAFYPSLNISASSGWTNNIGEIVNPWQMLSNAIGSLVQPLFNKGKNKANLAIAKARQEQALVAFNQVLLVAGSELNDALTACARSEERLVLREQEVAAARQAYDVSIELFKSGSSTYLEVLTAQSSLLQSRSSLASDRLDLIQGQINLFKALGGLKCVKEQ